MSINTNLTSSGLAAYFDHIQLRAYAVHDNFARLCEENMEYDFKMAAINPAQVIRCRELSKGSPIHVGITIGFPLDQTTIVDKTNETKTAIESGSDEIDYVVNTTRLKEKNYNYIEEEMAGIVDIYCENRVISKMVFEDCYLTEVEKEELCRIVLNVKPDFIKTSTGLSTREATLEDTTLMEWIVGDRIIVEAVGGVRNLDTALKLIDPDVSRIGSTVSVTILEEYKSRLQNWLIHTEKRPDMTEGDLSGVASDIFISDHQRLWEGGIPGLLKNSLLRSKNKTPNRKGERFRKMEENVKQQTEKAGDLYESINCR